MPKKSWIACLHPKEWTTRSIKSRMGARKIPKIPIIKKRWHSSNISTWRQTGGCALESKKSLGLNGGSKFSASIKNSPVSNTMSAISEKRAKSFSEQQCHPSTNEDDNWLISRKIKQAERMRAQAVKEVDCMKSLSNWRLITHPAASPENFHYDKRLSINRRSKIVILSV